MKFKIDENLPAELADMLTLARHDAATVPGQGLQGTLDRPLAETCQRENRILVTLDLGFADIRAYPPASYPGLIMLRVARQDKWHMMRVFQQVIPVLGKESPQNALWIVEESRIRVQGR